MGYDAAWVRQAVRDPGHDPMANVTKHVVEATDADAERVASLLYAWSVIHARHEAEPDYPEDFKRWAIARLRAEQAPAEGEGEVPPPDPIIEERFNQAMLDIYTKAGDATGYWANYFLREVRAKGGIFVAHKLLWQSGTSKGFDRLKVEKRLDLSLEALILRPEFVTLFSSADRERAEDRLRDHGYDPRTK